MNTRRTTALKLESVSQRVFFWLLHFCAESQTFSTAWLSVSFRTVPCSSKRSTRFCARASALDGGVPRRLPLGRRDDQADAAERRPRFEALFLLSHAGSDGIGGREAQNEAPLAVPDAQSRDAQRFWPIAGRRDLGKKRKNRFREIWRSETRPPAIEVRGAGVFGLWAQPANRSSGLKAVPEARRWETRSRRGRSASCLAAPERLLGKAEEAVPNDVERRPLCHLLIRQLIE
jgi:hypothetical protein